MDIKTFLQKSEHFHTGFLEGQFFDFIHIHLLYNEYLKSGNHYLGDYFSTLYCANNVHLKNYITDYRMIIALENHVSNIRRLRILELDIIYDALDFLKSNKKYALKMKQYYQSLPRRKANDYVRQKDVRSYVIGKYGNACLCCGSIKSISIDHVIPISMGGKNELENLQILCKSCNSRKGSKTIDYRANG